MSFSPKVHSLEFTLAVTHSMDFDKYVVTCICHCHYSIVQSLFTTLKIFLCSACLLIFLPGNHWCFCHSFVFASLSLIGVIQYVAFSDWLFSCSNMHFPMSFHCLVAPFFLFLSTVPLSVPKSLFSHSPAEGLLGCFQVLTVMNKGSIEDIRFELLSLDTREHDCWILW